jgi:branched-chain amino acid transport system permease protein
VREVVLALAINGLVWGLIIALIALGLSIIFGLLDIINVAHGDFFMLGTVGGLVLTTLTGSFWLALVLVPIIGFVIGIVLERVVIRPTIRQASLTIVTTFGLSMMLEEGVRATYGPQPRRMEAPIGGTVPLFGIDYDIYRLFAAAFAALCLALFFLFPQPHQARHLDPGRAARSRNGYVARHSRGADLRHHLRPRHGHGPARWSDRRAHHNG